MSHTTEFLNCQRLASNSPLTLQNLSRLKRFLNCRKYRDIQLSDPNSAPQGILHRSSPRSKQRSDKFRDSIRLDHPHRYSHVEEISRGVQHLHGVQLLVLGALPPPSKTIERTISRTIRKCHRHRSLRLRAAARISQIPCQ